MRDYIFNCETWTFYKFVEGYSRCSWHSISKLPPCPRLWNISTGKQKATKFRWKPERERTDCWRDGRWRSDGCEGSAPAQEYWKNAFMDQVFRRRIVVSAAPPTLLPAHLRNIVWSDPTAPRKGDDGTRVSGMTGPKRNKPRGDIKYTTRFPPCISRPVCASIITAQSSVKRKWTEINIASVFDRQSGAAAVSGDKF